MSKAVEYILMMRTLVFHQHQQIQYYMDHSQEGNIGVKHYPVGYPGKTDNHQVRSKTSDDNIIVEVQNVR